MLELRRGDTLQLRGKITFRDNGVDLSFAGVTPTVTVRRVSSEGKLSGWLYAPTFTWLDQSAGLYEIVVEDEVTKEWKAAAYVIEVELGFGDGTVHTFPRGEFTVTERVAP